MSGLPVNHMGQLAEADKEIYRMLHTHHCERSKQPDHICQGTISIKHDHVTLRCPLCGNCKASTEPA